MKGISLYIASFGTTSPHTKTILDIVLSYLGIRDKIMIRYSINY